MERYTFPHPGVAPRSKWVDRFIIRSTLRAGAALVYLENSTFSKEDVVCTYLFPTQRVRLAILEREICRASR